MLITLNIKQRLELQAAIRGLCRGKKKDPKRRQGGEVLAKFKIPADEMLRYEIEVPGQGAIRNQVTISKGPAVGVDLTKEDARFLEALMAEGFTNLGPEDDEWLEPLEEALAKVSE
jgi:hypothetical protein